MTGGRGPDACIDAVGMEAHVHGFVGAYDRAKQALRLATDRPGVLRQAIQACRKGGTFPFPASTAASSTSCRSAPSSTRRSRSRAARRTCSATCARCWSASSAASSIPSFIISHRLSLDEAPRGYEMFKHKEEECVKVVLKPSSSGTADSTYTSPRADTGSTAKPKSFASRAQLRAWLERHHASAAGAEPAPVQSARARARRDLSRGARRSTVLRLDRRRAARTRRRQLHAALLAAPTRQQVESGQSPPHARAAGCRVASHRPDSPRGKPRARSLPAIRSNPSPSRSRSATCRSSPRTARRTPTSRQQAPWYRRTTSFYVMSAKQEATRQRRLAHLIACCEQQRPIALLDRKTARKKSKHESP